MARRRGKKGSKKGPRAAAEPRQRAARLEKALAAGLKREAKAASRLEAAQLEVAVLRAALAEVVGEEPAEFAPAPVSEAEAAPKPKPAPATKAPAARPRRTARPAPADR
jgi:outer membrane protein TolC